MKARFAIFIALVACICFITPGHSAAAEKRWPEQVDRLLATAKESVNKVTMEEFKEVVASKDYDLIVDVREPNEYEAGHVSGAINIPRGTLEFKIWPHVGFPDNTDMKMRIYIYCRTGGRSSLATKSLKDLGFKKVTLIDMKIAEWIEAGYPTEK